MTSTTDNLFTFYVNPDIPEKLSKLYDLSNNLWSTWDKNAIRLFNRIDPIIYRECQQNPVMLLHLVSHKRLEELCNDKGFMSELDYVYQSFLDYMSWTGYYTDNDNKHAYKKDNCIAYFSMEYGLHESIPIYSGGLGLLSGDYIKAASDQAIPLVGFGLLYKYGYFTQFIDFNGEQREKWRENKWHLMPVRPLRNKNGENLILKVNFKNEDILIKVWTIDVGQIKLYLLDTDFPQNSDFARQITNKLYDSDRTIRLFQELVLSFGAVELMESLHIKPKVYHLNEGHSAFLILRRLIDLINKKKYTFDEASQIITNSTIFTTHTPVTAGNEHFHKDLIKQHLTDLISSSNINIDDFLELASIPKDKDNFWLPALALRYSRYVNGVSKIHSKTSKLIWRDIFPNLAIEEIPIGHITNAVHAGTWLSRDMSLLFDRYLGVDYLHTAEKKSIWQNIAKIPDIEIWEAHQRRKEQMISFIRQRIEQKGIEEEPYSDSPAYNGSKFPRNKNMKLLTEQKKMNYPLSKKLQNTLSPDVLTIGFARRFAPYKRANLILQDPERILSIIRDESKPVQFVIAGKAHPADTQGKILIKNLIDFAKDNDIDDRFVFIEDYDINVAKHLVQGVDVWLNTPIKPYEASGTSGMKAGLNGVINFSILDGWWPECFDGENGWAIKTLEYSGSRDVSDSIEANQIYDIIERKIAPLYYRRNESNLPVEWLQKMKHSIYTVGKEFNMHRMLREYVDKFYIPASKSLNKLNSPSNKFLKEILEQEKRVKKYWDNVYIKDFHLRLKRKQQETDADNKENDIPITSATTVNNGDTIIVTCYVFIGDSPEDILIAELFRKQITTGKIEITKLKFHKLYEDKVAHYQGQYTVNSSGLQGVNVRIRANISSYLQNYNHLIKWKTSN